MKKSYKYFLSLLLIIGIAFVTGCKKDDDGDEPPTFEGFGLTEEEIISRIPDGLMESSDVNAQTCVNYIESAADWSSFYYELTPPAGAVKVSNKSTAGEGTWKWSAPFEDHTITYYWTYEETSTQYMWTMQIQFDNGTKYNYIEAWEMKDGTQGVVKFNFGWTCIYYELYYEEYYEDCAELYWVYTWNKSASGVINYTWLVEDPEYDYAFKYELVLNPDSSGTLDFYSESGDTHYHYEWDALGNGSWVWYYEGEIFMSGTWTV